MKKIDALDSIKRAWDDQEMKLGDKIISISSDYYSAGLDLATTAAHIHATPAELDFLLSLGEFEDEVLEQLSEIDPPKTTWMMIANGSDEEVEGALSALRQLKGKSCHDYSRESSMTEYVYISMVDIEGPTSEQMVSDLSGDTLRHALKKGKSFNLLNDWEEKFLKSVSAQKKRGKVLSNKQSVKLAAILNKLVDNGAIVRESIDGDTEICNQILDALGR